jgi:hypothetical protein
LLRREGICNPAVLNGGLNEMVDWLSRLNRGKVYAQDTSGQDAAQGRCGLISVGFYLLGKHPFADRLIFRHGDPLTKL